MNDERDEAERAALEKWGTDWSAPPELRGRVLEAARKRGLVEGRIMSRRGFWMGAVAAAAALMFVVGFGLGSRRAGGDRIVSGTKAEEAPVKIEEKGSPRYALFLFEDDAYQNPPADQMMERVGEYGGWARELAASGRFVDGEKLADDGRFCRIDDGALAATSPQSDAKRGRLTGYFVIGAMSLEEAVEVAKGCPHLKYGGTLEIRQIES